LFEDIQDLYASLAKTTGPEFLQDLTVMDQLCSGSEKLKQLVGRSVKLGDLVDAINRLTEIEGQLAQLDEPLQGMLSALAELATRHLTVSESGLTEFKTVIELIASLAPSCWKYRGELFDNEELDEMLPQLRAELAELRGLHDIVHGVFSLENVPDESEIRQLAATLASGGVFRWFKGDWRAARKRLLSCAASTQVKYPSMVRLLDDLATFAGKRRKLEDNTRYKEALGEHLRGLETDLAALESLRAWDKRVRQQYGVGFGQKVPLGDAISICWREKSCGKTRSLAGSPAIRRKPYRKSSKITTRSLSSCNVSRSPGRSIRPRFQPATWRLVSANAQRRFC
jgi:hypothetical protein